MFVIEMRKCSGSVWSKWFPIWHSEDGPGSAAYLKSLYDDTTPGREYRMGYRPAATKPEGVR